MSDITEQELRKLLSKYKGQINDVDPKERVESLKNQKFTKQYYYDWNKEVKWVLYKSSFHGFRAERQEDFYREEY